MEPNFLNYSWLKSLSNSNHDSSTEQIYGIASAFVTDNASYNNCVQALRTCRDNQDAIWNRSQRDPAAAALRMSDARMDAYIRAARYYIAAHAGLPADEPTVEEAQACQQVFTDIDYKSSDGYGSASDKVIQMRQNLLPHETFLTQIGAWPLYEKGNTEALEVRRLLTERAATLGEFVKGELKNVRRQTDLAIADLYRVIEAMQQLMPSSELTSLINQLKGIEIYAKTYYISSGSSSSGSSSSGSGSGSGSGTGTGTGDDPATGGSGTGSDPGTGTGTGGDSGGSGGSDGGGYDYSDDGME